jgi:dihydroorotase
MNLTIKNARLICPASGLDAVQNVHISGAKIVAMNDAAFQADRVIDGAGCVLAPGLMDLSVRLREPGHEYKGALEQELQAAVAGGVTTVVCPPDTDPVLDEPGLVEMIKRRAASVALAQVLPLGALTLGLKGESLTEMAELTEAGCVAFSQGGVSLEATPVRWRMPVVLVTPCGCGRTMPNCPRVVWLRAARMPPAWGWRAFP